MKFEINLVHLPKIGLFAEWFIWLKANLRPKIASFEVILFEFNAMIPNLGRKMTIFKIILYLFSYLLSLKNWLVMPQNCFI